MYIQNGYGNKIYGFSKNSIRITLFVSQITIHLITVIQFHIESLGNRKFIRFFTTD